MKEGIASPELVKKWLAQGRVNITPASASDQVVPVKGAWHKKGEGNGLHLRPKTIALFLVLDPVITHHTVMRELEVVRMTAANILYHWKQMGWIESVSWGVYRRTDLFGKKID